MADLTTGELPAVKVGELPPAGQIYDDLLIPGEFQAKAVHVTGKQLKDYAAAGTLIYVDNAKESAESAAKSAESAAGSAKSAANSAIDANTSANRAEQYSGKPPQIKNGTWWTWNASAQTYEDTGEAARGNLMYAAFWLDVLTGNLYMYTDDEYTGPSFRLNGNNLEVILNAGRIA